MPGIDPSEIPIETLQRLAKNNPEIQQLLDEQQAPLVQAVEKAQYEFDLAMTNYQLVVSDIRKRARSDAEEELREELLLRQKQEEARLRRNQRALGMLLTFLAILVMALR